MNRALIYATLTIVLLLTSFQVHSQSEENELPSCMGYDFNSEQSTRISNRTDRIEDAIEVFTDTDELTDDEFVEEVGRWAVFADSAWVRFYTDPAQCFEYIEHERLYRDLIASMYSLATQFSVYTTLTDEFQIQNVSDLVNATFSTTQQTIEELMPLMDALNEARLNQP